MERQFHKTEQKNDDFTTSNRIVISEIRAKEITYREILKIRLDTHFYI